MTFFMLKPCFLHVLSLFVRVADNCMVTFSSGKGTTGTFTSPQYPKTYPKHSTCKYIFQGNLDEKIKITFQTFDLEPGTPAGCLFDYIDVFTIDVDQVKNLEMRWCGSTTPPPFISAQQRLELDFKSDEHNINRKGFVGQYEFVGEDWQPFPVTTNTCIHKSLSGVGGELVSPGYPVFVPLGVMCMWTIKVEVTFRIVLNFIEVDLSETENCDESFVAIYNGFASPFEKAAEKLCKIRGKKEFKSKGFRLGVRFESSSSIEYQMKGFRIIWTAVWVPKEDQSDYNYSDDSENECREFHCKGGEYCIDTSHLLCNPLQRYCIHSSLKCNSVPNCGAFDHSDEDGCVTPTLLVWILIIVVFGLILFMLFGFLFWCRRKQRRMKKLTMEKQRQRRSSLVDMTVRGSLPRKCPLEGYKQESDVIKVTKSEFFDRTSNKTKTNIRHFSRTKSWNSNLIPEGNLVLNFENMPLGIIAPDAGVNISPCRPVVTRVWNGVVYSELSGETFGRAKRSTSLHQASNQNPICQNSHLANKQQPRTSQPAILKEDLFPPLKLYEGLFSHKRRHSERIRMGSLSDEGHDSSHKRVSSLPFRRKQTCSEATFWEHLPLFPVSVRNVKPRTVSKV